MSKDRIPLGKNRKMIYLIARNITLVCFLLLGINSSKLFLIKHYINLNLFCAITFLVDFIALTIYSTSKKNLSKHIRKVRVKPLLSVINRKTLLNIIFFLCLFLIASAQIFGYFDTFWSKKIIAVYSVIQNKLIIFTTIIGALIFYLNKRKINNNLEKAGGELYEQKRKKEFPEKFLKINKIPVFRSFARWIHKEGWLYSIGLIVILVLFVSIRAPYMNYSFEGVDNSSKYTTHLPNLINMYENHNPFLNQNQAYTPIFNNESNISFDNFGYFPFLEWTFLPFMPLTKFLSLEVLIRSLLTAAGILLLFLIYLFLKKIFNKKIGLLGILLLAFNQLFQLVTYLTVMDFPALIFMFAALNLYLNNKKNLSYVFCGLSVLAKYSFLLITFPALALLILFNKRDDIYSLAKLGLFSMMPMLLFEKFMRPIPSKTFAEGIIRLLLMPFLICVTYYLIKKYDGCFENLTNKINKKIRYALIVLLPIISIFILRSQIMSYASSLLTERSLIFNWGMYKQILEKIKELIPNFAYYLFPLGFIIGCANKKSRRIFFSVLAAGFIYLVIASKGVFPHLYYKHIFLIISILSLCYLFNLTLEINKNKIIKILFAGAMVILLIIPSYHSTADILDRRKSGTREMSLYIKTNLETKDKMIIIGGTAGVFTIYNRVKTIYYTIPEDQRDRIIKEIQEKGFVKTMQDYGIKYYMTAGERDFKDIIPWFDKRHDFNCDTKMGLVLTKAGQKRCLFEDELEKIYEEYKPYQYFRLDAKIGDFYLYKLKEQEEIQTEKYELVN